MAAYHGSKASFRIGTYATPTVLVDVSTYLNTSGMPLSRDVAETTTFHAQSKSYIPGISDGQFPMGGPFDPTIDQQMWDLYNNSTLVNWEYCPAGLGTTGTAKYTGTGYVTQYQVNSQVSGASTFTGQFQNSGTISRTVQ